MSTELAVRDVVQSLKPSGAPAMFKAWQEHVEAGPHPEVLFDEARPLPAYK